MYITLLHYYNSIYSILLYFTILYLIIFSTLARSITTSYTLILISHSIIKLFSQYDIYHYTLLHAIMLYYILLYAITLS